MQLTRLPPRATGVAAVHAVPTTTHDGSHDDQGTEGPRTAGCAVPLIHHDTSPFPSGAEWECPAVRVVGEASGADDPVEVAQAGRSLQACDCNSDLTNTHWHEIDAGLCDAGTACCCGCDDGFKYTKDYEECRLVSCSHCESTNGCKDPFCSVGSACCDWITDNGRAEITDNLQIVGGSTIPGRFDTPVADGDVCSSLQITAYALQQFDQVEPYVDSPEFAVEFPNGLPQFQQEHPTTTNWEPPSPPPAGCQDYVPNCYGADGGPCSAGWCSHTGAQFYMYDCDGDGVNDPTCQDGANNFGALTSSNGCAGNPEYDWPNGRCSNWGRRLLVGDEGAPSIENSTATAHAAETKISNSTSASQVDVWSLLAEAQNTSRRKLQACSGTIDFMARAVADPANGYFLYSVDTLSGSGHRRELQMAGASSQAVATQVTGAGRGG